MSWFTKKVEHPALSALAALVYHPAIQANPDAVAAVTQVRADATAIASTATSAAHSVASQVQADADPIIGELSAALRTALDAALIAYLGPVGTALTPAANSILALLEDRLHTLVAALFTHAKAQSAPSGEAA